MAFRQMSSMELDDDEKIDRMFGTPEGLPDYPPGLQFTIDKADLGKFCDGECSPGMTLRFAAMGNATSVYRSVDSVRIEVELREMAGEDGKFVEMDRPPSICLCGPELEKLDLDEECERGDMIHIIGTARVESLSSPAYGGDMVGLQIVEMCVEDESEESRG
jgi:hypothetical protein